MENATKALLIGASILIAILLITIGMRVFNSGAKASQSSGAVMQTTEIATFNAQFSGYNGKTVSSSKANDIIQKIKASNAVNSSKQITCNSTIDDGKKYKVAIINDTNTGYVSEITFTEIIP